MTKYNIAASSELMENYIHTDFLLPQDKFIALQTNAGASLLFSIGTGGAFMLTVESPGETHGWRQTDLGAARIKSDFGGNATVKTFGAAQAAGAPGQPAEIHLAMVVSDGTSDHLYLSLRNSDSNLDWVGNPIWVPAPFNAADSGGKPITPPSPLLIVNVFLSEATDKEYIVVDTIRDPGQAGAMLTRYYVDGSLSGDPKWQLHDLAADFQADGYDSCLGRSAHAFGVDGIYTKGIVGTAAQLIYTPLYNAFDSSMPPLPSRLGLPGGLVADAIAAVRNPDNSSDLYVASAGNLFWFASANQHDGAIGVKTASDQLLNATRALYASESGGTITVWGLNGSDQVFYLTCQSGQQANPTAWSRPLPIITGVDAISPFIDRGYSANTFFAHTGDGLVKLVKSPGTSIWNQRHITLPPSVATRPATPVHSYTTHIQVTDETGLPAPNVAVILTATNVVSVYINHLYYIIGPQPIEVATDARGAVTIMETVTTLAGTRFHVSVASQPEIAVNTMDTAWQRNAQYTTADSLRAAKIVSRDGSSRNFIPSGTSDDTLREIAASNQSLAQAYSGLATTSRPATVRAAAMRLAPMGVTGGILADLGDLLRWLESGVEAVVKLIKDAAEEVWHFVVTIGETVYHAALDCVETIVAAAVWVYNAIKTAVEDVVKFLEFVFAWDDILITHKVIKSILLSLSRKPIDEFETLKADAKRLFANVQHQIDTWAGIPDLPQTTAAIFAANPPQAALNSAPANLGVHHFQGNVGSASSNVPVIGPAVTIFDDLIKMMETEGETLSGAVNAIKTDIIDQFSTLSLTEVMKRLLAIIADTILGSVENVVVTVLDVVEQLVQGVIDILTAKLDIPVLSWLYHDLTGEDLSFLDVVSLIAAIPVTVVYKAAAGKAPFPKGDPFTHGLIGARNLSEIQALFIVPRKVVRARIRGPEALLAADAATAVLNEDQLKTCAFATGLLAFVGSLVLVTTADLQRKKGFAWMKLAAVIGAVGNVAYVSPSFGGLINATNGNWATQVNNNLTLISIAKGFVAIVMATDTLRDNKDAAIGFASFESYLNLIWNIPVIANVAINASAYSTTYQSLIPETFGNFAFNFGGMLEGPIAILDKLDKPGPKEALIEAQRLLMCTYSTMMIVAGSIYRFAANQSH